MRDSFLPLLGDVERVEAAVGFYLERFGDVGYRECRIYDGIAETIEALSARGHQLAVVTAKNEPHSRKIVSGFEFGGCFDTIVGATPCGRISRKPDLIAEALARLALHTHDCVMIGDRHMDIDGARHHDMRSIGVLWGFGTPDELAHADLLVNAPRELVAAMSRVRTATFASSVTESIA